MSARLNPALLAALSLATLPPAISAVVLQDDFEDGLTNWSATGTWGIEHGAVSDSPGAFYLSDSDSALTLAIDLDLSTTTSPVVSFNHRYDLEEDYDFATVEASIDGGVTWPNTLATYTGRQTDRFELLDLSALAGQANVRLRFRLITDGSVIKDGWTLDDVTVGEAPVPVACSAPTDLGRNHIALDWSASGDPDFASYRILRSRTASFDWKTAHLVAEITDAAITNYTDISVSPKTRYHYRIIVTTIDALGSESNEVSALTLAGIDYPFLDNGEGGGATWVADAPWALSDEVARSGSFAWSDSPGADYANGIAAQSLTLSAPLDLSSATAPVWTFWYRSDLEAGDLGYAEVSLDEGSSWTTLASLATTNNTADWTQARIALDSYLERSVLLRFRLTTNASGSAEGIQIDDISVAEAPAAIPAPAMSGIGSHTITLSWAASSHPQLKHYALYRAIGTDGDLYDQAVAEIDASAGLSYTDTGLLLNTNYAYRIYAVTQYGTHSPDSEHAATAHTLSQPPPHTEDFEGDDIAWTFGSNNANPSTWAISDEAASSGSACLTDSPNSSYASSRDTYAETAVDLSGTEWPVLTFWDKFDLNSGDWLRLEISASGGPTAQVYGTYQISSRATWQQQRIDLSPWKGLANVRLRFRLVTDGGATPGDGWFIDQLEVAENPDAATPASLPLTEDFEGSIQEQWLAAGWHPRNDDSAIDGARSARSTPGDYLSPDTQHWLTLDQPLALPADSNLQATFWLRGRLTYKSYFRLQTSTNGGISWSDLSANNINYTWENEDNWTRLQADLSGFKGQTLRLRFAHSNSGAPVTFLHLDKLTLAEMPAAVNLLSAVPALRSIDLTWDASTLGADFVRYELWRSTSAKVSVTNGEQVFVSTSLDETTATDTGLNIGGTYYYKLFVVDQRDTYIPSNELSATTVPVVLPLSDNLDTVDNWVIGSNNASPATWAIATSGMHEGTGCLAAVPVGQYQPGSDTYAETAVDLSDTEWPVLTFWDKFDLNSGDWFRLEISATGGPTAQVYGTYQISSRATWQQQRIDLSPWKGLANVRLRFRLVTDGGATPGDGWFIDQLEVAENPDAATPASLPLTEDFEGSIQEQWLAAGWHPRNDDSAIDGARSARSTPGDYLSPDTQHWLTLDQPLALPADSNLQATFWLRGRLTYKSYFRLQTSTNDGISWSDLSANNINYTWENEDNWTRLQADLSGFKGQTLRLRFAHSNSGAPVTFLHLDKLTLAEMPAAVNLLSAVPALRSIDLTWDASPLGADFVRYELWRSTSAKVSVTNGEQVFVSTSLDETTATDTGLNIGGTYYYKLFVVDQRDTYIPSNELSATTVPVVLPLSDNLDTVDNWVIGSNNASPATWAIATSGMHEGTGCLAAVPVGQYQPGSDTYAETAVDLSDTEWPVLTFWDKFDLNTGDWFRLEISATGGPTAQVYGTYQISSRATWQQQRIDLSPWKGLANVRLRFRLVTDGGATPGDGWFVDQLEVAENPDAATPASLPLTEDFEGSIQEQWLAAGWHPRNDDSAIDGARSARSTPGDYLSPDTQHWLTLDQPLALPADSNLQATFWLRGRLTYKSYFRLQTSTNDGISWSDLSANNINYTWENEDNWTRLQADLSGFKGQTLRLRFAHSNSGAPVTFLHLDKLTLAEMPAAVSAQPIDAIEVTSLRLNWIPSSLSSFARYRIYRSTTSTVTTASELIEEITDAGTSTYADTGLEARTTYYYKVYVVDDRDSHSPSDTVSATTLGLTLPLADSFEGDLDGWTVTGAWQLLAGVGREGSAALVDSAGDYAASTDTHARFAVDLTGMEWPVLKFWDKFAFAGSAWGRVEISTNGTSWGNYIYGVTGTRNEWKEQSLDLSPWKDQGTVFIRFRRATDGNLADGWTIDDLSLAENVTDPVYPLWDDFESDTGLWLASRWLTVEENPKAGDRCLHDSPEGRYGPDVQNELVLARELDLTGAVNPVLSFYMRGNLVYKSYFRVRVSTDDGLTWKDIAALNTNYTYDSTETWEFKQVSLAEWLGQKIRLRFVTSSSGQPVSSIFLDNIGIGEAAPDAPSAARPLDNESVDILRPTLVTNNAIDYQSDALTYRFEVYSDEALTEVVAQVPAVASGLTTTSWTVDVNLPDNATYYWRARANDGAHDGPWSDAVVFFVNETNTGPDAITHIGPPEGAVFYDTEEWLIWETASDPDVGDSILDYTLEIDNDPAFGSPLVSVTALSVDPSIAAPGNLVGLPLKELAGSDSLAAGRWYWRVRARDTRFSDGAWPSAAPSFRIASDFEHWILSAYSVAEQDSPAIAGPRADPDRDHIPLMMEFACMMDTAEASLEGAPEQILVNLQGVPHLGFEFDRRTGTDLKFVLEASSTMREWTDTEAPVEVLRTLDATTERCRLVDPEPIGSGRILRVTVKLPE